MFKIWKKNIVVITHSIGCIQTSQYESHSKPIQLLQIHRTAKKLHRQTHNRETSQKLWIQIRRNATQNTASKGWRFNASPKILVSGDIMPNSTSHTKLRSRGYVRYIHKHTKRCTQQSEFLAVVVNTRPHTWSFFRALSPRLNENYIERRTNFNLVHPATHILII